MSVKNKVIVIVGKSGVGKDFLKKYLLEHFEQTELIKLYTTRPKRNDLEEKDYIFCDEDTIKEKMKKDVINIIYSRFNDWIYAIDLKELKNRNNKIKVVILNKDLLKIVYYYYYYYFRKELNLDLFIIEVKNKNPEDRLLNAIYRKEDNKDLKEICRRYIDDEINFNIPDSWISSYFINDKNKEVKLNQEIINFIEGE